MDSIKYGVQNPKSDFDKRPNDTNAATGCSYVKGNPNAIPKSNIKGTQTKGRGSAKK